MLSLFSSPWRVRVSPEVIFSYMSFFKVINPDSKVDLENNLYMHTKSTKRVDIKPPLQYLQIIE